MLELFSIIDGLRLFVSSSLSLKTTHPLTPSHPSPNLSTNLNPMSNDSVTSPPPPLPPSPPLNLGIHALITSQQQTHGLKFNDYASYCAFLSRRLRRVRKSVKFVNKSSEGGKRNRKYEKHEVTEEVCQSSEFLEIVLVEAERAWAFAMELKEAMMQDGSGKGRRSQFISRLRKATKHTKRLDR